MLKNKQLNLAGFFKLVLVIPFLIGIVCCSNSKKRDLSAKDILKKSPVPVEWSLAFDRITHDFENIKESEGPVSVDFHFVNRSEEPIVINNVKATCGCTTPEWTHEPVDQGNTGHIKVTYNPRNRIGMFNKSITVSTNGNPETITLIIKGTVLKE
jgi:hypothetical protein